VTDSRISPTPAAEPPGGAYTPTVPATSPPVPPRIAPEQHLSPQQWGMLAFLTSEVAFFSTLIVTYLSFFRSFSGPGAVQPTPQEALALPLVLVTTTCLLFSSLTVHLAEKALGHGSRTGFCMWWGLTTALGISFLAGTAYEWHDLISRHGLTISRNMFGTCYYTVVGFHALHVTGGVVALLIVLGLALRGQVTQRNPTGPQLVSWYWHFVDVVWVVVFSVVYLGSLFS